MKQILSCKTSDCDKDVEFEYDPVPAVDLLGRVSVTTEDSDGEEEEVSAYLTCEDGHQHKYTVSITK